MPSYQSNDRTLIDLRDERDHLSIQISLLKDGERTDPAVLFGLQRELELLDRRIAKHGREPDA